MHVNPSWPHLFGQLFLSLCLTLVMTAAASATQNHLTVTYQHQQQHLQIKHCFLQAPAYVRTRADGTAQMTSTMLWNDKAVKIRRSRAYLPTGKKGCLKYTVNASKNADRLNSSRFKNQHPETLLVKINQWLWQASDHNQRALPEVEINHAAHIKVSAPWQLLQRQVNKTTYQMKPTPRYASGFVAFGPMAIKQIQLDKSTLRLAVLPGKYNHRVDVIEQWVSKMAQSVATVSQGFPVSDVQVLVILSDGHSGAVPWGQVNRAGGQGVLFIVNATKSRQELFNDWTAAHEFSHLLTPYTPNDRWLSEGFASYHQNISRLRSGLLNESDAWSKILAGFERGYQSASAYNAPALEQAGRRNNMQMYWGGAVIALKADVALQQKTDGGMDLSLALAGLKDCCLDTGKAWSAESLFNELDRITNTRVFSNLYEQEVKHNPFPEFRQMMRDLGIKTNRYNRVVMDDSAPLAKVRKRIGQG